MNIKRQICVVGAGPAGMTTSLFLSKKGIKSTLVDRAVFPRDKPCADVITGNTIRILDELDIDFIQNLRAEEKSLPIKGVVTFSPGNHMMKLDFLPLEKETNSPSCYAIPRIHLDHELIKKVKQDPLIEVIEGYQVKEMTQGENCTVISSPSGSITAGLAIVCTGSNTNPTHKLTPNRRDDRHRSSGVRAYYTGVKPSEYGAYSELYLSREIMPGGIYVTYFADGMVNANIVVRSDAVKRKKLNLRRILEETLATHPLLKERFANATMVGKPQAASLLLGTKNRKISGDNFLKVGDAAGLIDLLSANGIPQAMLSAKIAAEYAAKCVLTDDFSAKALANYDQEVFDRIKGYLKLSKIMSPILSSELVLSLISKGMDVVAKKYDNSTELQELVNDGDATKRLLSPRFYRKLFFGVKNQEAMA